MNETTAVLPTAARTPEVQELTNSAGELAHRYDTYAVINPDDYILAAEDLKQIKTKLGELEERRMAITRPMDASKKAVMALFAGPVDALKRAETGIKRALGAYQAEQERIADEQRRIEAERRRKEEEKLRRAAAEKREAEAKKERERLEREAVERERLAAIEREKEAKRQARIDAERRVADAETAERLAVEQQRLDAERAKRETDERAEQDRIHDAKLAADAAAQESARADILEARADDTTAAPIVSAAPKVKGLSGRKIWKFEITDATKIPRQYLKVGRVEDRSGRPRAERRHGHRWRARLLRGVDLGAEVVSKWKDQIIDAPPSRARQTDPDTSHEAAELANRSQGDR